MIIDLNKFKLFFYENFDKKTLKNFDFVVLSGSIVTDSFIDGWSDIDVVIFTRNFTIETSKNVAHFEEIASIFFKVNVGISIIYSSIIKNSIKHKRFDSMYLKYYKIFLISFESVNILYSDIRRSFLGFCYREKNMIQ